MTVFELFKKLESTPGRKDKEYLLATEADEDAKCLLGWALNPYITFGIKDVPKPTGSAPSPAPADEAALCSQRVGEFVWFLDDLNARKIVGNHARDMATAFLNEQPQLWGKWFRRVLMKDLRFGMTAKTVNKVFPGLVPTFEVQLAETYSPASPINFPVWVDYKLDGIRCIALKSGGRVRLYTRKGHEIETLPSIVNALQAAQGDFMLDGEVLGRDWNESQSTVFATKNVVDDSKIAFNVFDSMPLEDWHQSKSLLPYLDRREGARLIVESLAAPNVRVVEGMNVGSQNLVHDFYTQALQEGHEGIMIKDPEAAYTFGRSKALLKMKPSQTWEGEIIGWTKGEQDGKWGSSFGAFRVQFSEDGPSTFVGGGFSDKQRDIITQNLLKDIYFYDKQIIEVKGQEMKDGVVRFPVFVRFRDERDK